MSSSARRIWGVMTGGIIVGLLLAVVAVRPVHAARWSMIDGIGPRPALDVEDGLSYCLDGMQIGVALIDPGVLNIGLYAAGRVLFEGDLTVNLPVSVGDITHPNGDTYYYTVSEYFRIPWNQALTTATSASMHLRLGAQEWYKTIQISNCRMRASTPSAELVQVGPGNTSPLVSDALVFEVTARDTSVGPDNGDGIYALEMQIEDAGGKQVTHRTIPGFGRPYCGFGGSCNVWSYFPGSDWPYGPHRLVVVAHTLRGVQQRIAWDIMIGEKRAKSYRTNSAPILNGDLSEWTGAPEVVLESRTAITGMGSQASAANSSATVRSMWTPNHLYFAVSVTDDRIWNDGPQPWRDDEIEIGIDGLHDGIGTGADDHQYTANPDGRQTDQGVPTTTFQLKTRTRIDGWDAEFAIPVSQIKAGALTAGKVFGFNLSLRDDDDGGDGDRQQLWTGTTTYRVEPAWGTLTLVSDPAGIVSSPPSATLTSRGSTITLQAGKYGYSGVQDTFIDRGAPNTNNGGSVKLRLQDVNSPNALFSLLRFDLSAIPPGARVYRATLSLRAIERSESGQIYTSANQLTRDWAESEATWMQARTGVPWQTPGAGGSTDSAYAYVVSQNLWTVNAWFSLDVTRVVQGWVDNSWPNLG